MDFKEEKLLFMSSKPIRKRGYYRALKSGETWAVLRAQLIKINENLSKQMYGDPYTQMTEKYLQYKRLKEFLFEWTDYPKPPELK
jgi:hypothetical protein